MSMHEVERHGPSGKLLLSSCSLESGGMGYQERDEKTILEARGISLVLSFTVEEGRVGGVKTLVEKCEYEVSAFRLTELIKEHGKRVC